jgi:L-ascorbate metabolism protein UlaG (beta-lactamase superfamily)
MQKCGCPALSRNMSRAVRLLTDGMPFGQHGLWMIFTHKKVYFVGDTKYRTVRSEENEGKVPVCPAFAEGGEYFGGFDLALGAYFTPPSTHINALTDSGVSTHHYVEYACLRVARRCSAHIQGREG